MADGIKSIFNPNGTNAGINVGSHTANPGTPVLGDIFYDSTTDEFKGYDGAWINLGAPQSPWAADINAATFDLDNFGVLYFNTTGPAVDPPVNTVPYLWFDPDLTPDTLRINVASGQEVAIYVDGTEEYSFSSSLLDIFGNRLDNVGMLNFNDSTELTIATGEITVTQSYHMIDTEADASSDDLDTINGGTTGDIIILRTVDAARDVDITENGNIIIVGNTLQLTNPDDLATLLYDGTNWLLLAFSNNS